MARSRRWLQHTLVVLLEVGLLVAAAALGLVLLVHGSQRSPSPEARLVGFDPPVAVPEDGAYVRAKVLPSGGLEVDHWIRSTSKMVSRITLTTPNTPGLDRAHVVASKVTLQANGRDIPVRRTIGADDEAEVFTVAHDVHINYLLSGVLERSGPAHGRALLRAASLDVGTSPERGPTTVSVVGARVLSLACWSPTALADPRPCGKERRGSWWVDLGADHRHDRVLAQVDLG